MKPPIPPAEAPPRLVANVKLVRGRIEAAAARAGRDPASVTLVAVTKTVPATIARHLPAAGVTDAGENRIQAAEAKIPDAGPGLTWHMIGHLQRNKARRAATLFSVIHSVDSRRLLETLARLGEELGRTIRALLQVNISGEDQKHGLEADEVRRLLDVAAGLGTVEIRGFMGMAPFVEDPEEARPSFRILREIRDDANGAGWYKKELPELSMGMTNDFEIAVEEGATMVRVGTAVFQGVAEEP